MSSVAQVADNGSEIVSGGTSYSWGNQVGFYSREFTNTGTRIEEVTITGVPETGFTFGYVACAVFGLLAAVRN